MLDENEPTGTEDFKELYFTGNQRERSKSCLSEIARVSPQIKYMSLKIQFQVTKLNRYSLRSH
jgi:hypothetical protein